MFVAKPLLAEVDIGGGIIEYVLTNENHLIWQMGQSKDYSMCHVL